MTVRFFGKRPRGKRPGAQKDGPNKTEQRYADRLEIRLRAGEILWYRWDCLNLRLATLCWYKTDFLVLTASGHLELHEVKAMWGKKLGIEDDARVKLRVVADQFPFRVVIAAWDSKQKDFTFPEEQEIDQPKPRKITDLKPMPRDYDPDEYATPD